MIPLAAILILLQVAVTSAAAEPCRSGEAPRGIGPSRDGCAPREKLKPYEPDAQRAGRSPGYIDLGNGTEVRIGGRVQMDYDMRRR